MTDLNKNSDDALPKKNRSKEVIERARKIQAARRAQDAKIAAQERKERMRRRAEEKKAIAEKTNAKPKKKTNVANNTVSGKKTDNELELVDFAITARKYKTALTRKYKERKFWVNPSPFEIFSYIPGTIISVNVKAGKIIQEGEQLLILEAMKMQNRIDMPFTARIKKIHVKVGEKIPKDHLLFELEPIE